RATHPISAVLLFGHCYRTNNPMTVPVTPRGFEPLFSDRKSDVLGLTRRRGRCESPIYAIGRICQAVGAVSWCGCRNSARIRVSGVPDGVLNACVQMATGRARCSVSRGLQARTAMLVRSGQR